LFVCGVKITSPVFCSKSNPTKHVLPCLQREREMERA